MEKRSRVRKAVLQVLPAFLALACLAGCSREERKHYEEVEKNAETYYKNKYGDDAKVVDGFKAGNSGLFGYMGVDDRAYEMSDGTMVYWNDKEEYFADNRQAAQIEAALRSQVMEPAIEALDSEAVYTEYSFNRTGMESFDEEVFREYFDGDLECFCAKEVITVHGFDAIVHEAACPGGIEQFYSAVNEYFDGNAGCIVVYRDEYADEMPEDIDIIGSRGDVRVRAIAFLQLDDRLKWLENVYVDVIDGVKIMSNMIDITLEPGDVIFEETGTGADLQKKLDDAYYALPVDAKENEGGGYTARDRRHESRAVLSDPEAPVYRVRYSDRLRELVGEEEGQSFYVMVDFEEAGSLWRYIDEDPYRYNIWKAADYNVIRGYNERITEGNLFYFGEVSFEKFEE